MGIKRHDEFGRPNVRTCTCKDKSCREKWAIDFEDSETFHCPKCLSLHCPDCLRKMSQETLSSSSGSGETGNWAFVRCEICGYYIDDCEW